MLGNFIGGGQIFLHNLRMFIQVLRRAVITSIMIGVIIALVVIFPDFTKIDLPASMTYQKALLVNHFGGKIAKIKEIINPRQITTSETSNRNNASVTSNHLKKKHLTTIKINAYTKNGLYKEGILPGLVLDNEKFSIPYSQTLSLLKKLLLIWLILTPLTFMIIFALWTRFGKAAKERKHLSGHIIKSPKEVASYLRKNNKASDLTIGNIPLVKDSEVKHILITGSTGSGKTNCLHSLLPQIRAKRQPAIIIDTEGDMIARYYRPGRDIIINPFDQRAHHWNFWQEIKSARSLKKIATSFFPDPPSEVFNYDQKWTNWGRMLFIGILEYLRLEDEKTKIEPKNTITTTKKALPKSSKKEQLYQKAATIENLYNLIHKETIGSLSNKLKNTSVGTLISSDSDNNAAPHNIRINTLLATEWLEFILDCDDGNNNSNNADNNTNSKTGTDISGIYSNKSFCFHDWIAGLDNPKTENDKHSTYNNDSWVFIACDSGDNKILLPFISTITDVALNALISLGTCQDRRLWFVFDELARLKYLPALQENITLLRKYGGCILAATQSLNQLFSIYGRNSRNVMLGQFNTNVIFRILAADEARIVTKRIGEIEYLSHQKNTSYGAHEFRDEVSYTEQEKKQEVIEPSNLASLSEGECYILLPEPSVAICKTTLKLAPKPQNPQPAFIYNPEVEAIIHERQIKWQKQAKICHKRQLAENSKKVKVKNMMEQNKGKDLI